MIALLRFLLTLLVSPFRSKSQLEAENAALRHQLIVLQRRVRGRVQLTNGDRLFLVQLYRWFPSVLKAITIIRPETLVCIENLVRFDCVVESHNVSANGRADILLAERGYLALQVEEPA
jgi:hypothetical protein